MTVVDTHGNKIDTAAVHAHDKKGRGRPHTPCPSCGEGRREYQVVVQTRPLNYTDEHVSGKKEGARSNTLTVCASCAGKVRAELALALAAHDTWE